MTDQPKPRLSIGNGCSANVDKLTSDVFHEDFPPLDWADLGLLIPHEAIRRQMAMMVQSVGAMPDIPADNELWKVTLFAKWFCDYFFISIEEHHEAEEKIYFPWLKTKTVYPEEKFNKDHEELVADMTVMKKACEAISQKKGKDCSEEIALLKSMSPTFETDMRAHLKEEEESLPGLIRDNATQEEEGAIVDKIIQGGGLAMAKKFLPAIILAMQDWATPEYYEVFCGKIPPPIRHLAFTYYVPDFENVVMVMRDAPTLDKKPKLKKVGCCKIPFCFPCIL